MLSYARQVLELEKIATLEGREPEPPPEPLPSLGTPSAGALCLVCERAAFGTCAECGGVSYCSREHQWVDSTWHVRACAPLRELREDADFRQRVTERSLVARLSTERGGRSAQGAPDGWDEYLTGITAREPAERRAMADLASRPLTLARVLSSAAMAALPDAAGPWRVHVMAAAAKEIEAPSLYGELRSSLRASSIELSFVGPELPARSLENLDGVRFALRTGAYRQALWSELASPHLLVGFNAGLLIYPSWKDTLLELRGSGIQLVITSYRSWEARAEAELLSSLGAVTIQPPTDNPFASLAWRRSSTIANDVSQDNAYFSVWRF